MKAESEEIAFNLFREWTRNAASDYPEHDFTITDESVLVTDFLSALNDAMTSLFDDERIEDRAILGYDFGYVIGYIGGGLNRHWNYQYLMKRSDDYRGFMANKAILEYMKFDEIAGIRINSFYEELLKKNKDFQPSDFKIKMKQTTEYGLDQLHEDFNDGKNYVQIYLNHVIDKQIIEMIDKFDGDYLPNLRWFIDSDYVAQSVKAFKKSNHH